MKKHNEVTRRGFLASVGVITAGFGLTAIAACSNDEGGAAPTTDEGTTDAPSTGPVDGGTVTIGIAAVSAYMNPLTAVSANIAWVTEPVVEALYAYDENMESMPLLADGEPEISDDGLKWTIKLKEGITYSNGDPFTSEHVVEVLKFASDPSATSDWTNFFMAAVDSVEAEDDQTVVINLNFPFGVMRQHLTNIPIIHKDFIQKTDTTMGTGPFQIDEIIQEQQVTLVKNENYHGDAAALDSVVFKGIPDPGTRIVNLREGSIDVMVGVPPENVEDLGTDEEIDVHLVDAPRDILTYYGAHQAPFDDIRVRQAVAHAMDRTAVNELVFAGTSQVAQGPVSPAAEGYDPDANFFSPESDIEKARQLLEEAGQPNVAFDLMVSNTSPETMAMAEVLIEGWRAAGMNVTIDAVPGGEWVARWIEGDYQFTLNIFESGIGGGKTSYVLLSSFNSDNPRNFGYENAEVDALLKEAWATPDAKEREEACRKIGEHLAKDAICTPPVYPRFIVAQRNNVSEVSKRAMSTSRLAANRLQRMG